MTWKLCSSIHAILRALRQDVYEVDIPAYIATIYQPSRSRAPNDKIFL